MDDDLNTSGALAAAFDLVAEMNRVTDQVHKGQTEAPPALPGLADARSTLLEMTGVLGLALAEPGGDAHLEERVRGLAAALHREAAHLFAAEPGQTLEDVVTFILAGRERARAGRDFPTADRIRGRLADAGILVEDLPAGPRWRIATADGVRTPSDKPDAR